MTETEIAELAAWIAEVGLKGRAETAMVAGFCERLVAFGVPLARANVFIDTLHPVHEGRLFRWDRGSPEATLAEYGRSVSGIPAGLCAPPQPASAASTAQSGNAW